MQDKFTLSPINEVKKVYVWEDGAWPGDEGEGYKFAVLYRDKIVAIFDTLYWAKEFAKNVNLTLDIMKVDE